jgi:hypothetical protein
VLVREQQRFDARALGAIVARFVERYGPRAGKGKASAEAKRVSSDEGRAGERAIIGGLSGDAILMAGCPEYSNAAPRR